MTTDIKSALTNAQLALSMMCDASGDARSDALLYVCQQYRNVLTQLAEKVTQLDYRVEHLEEQTGHRTMREIMNRKDDHS